MKQHLILFTQIFPFGKGETFLENELPILAKKFESIFIVSENTKDNLTRNIFDNVQLLRFKPSKTLFQKIFSLRFLLKKEVFQEFIKILSNRNKLNHLKVLLDAILQAKQVEKVITNLIKEQKIKKESIVCYSYWLNNSAIALAYLKTCYPLIKCISRAHRWDIYEEFHTPNYLPLRNFISKKLDKIYSISKDGKAYLKSSINQTNLEKIQISRLGTINNFNVSSNNDFNHKTLNIVSCSSLIPRKRVDLIMKALRLLPKSLQVNWMHIGDGSLKNSLKEKSLSLMQENANLSINFLGFLPNKNTLELYTKKEFDFFINTSDSEGIPVSMMESMSFSIPCIGTNVGGVSEIIANGYNGFLLSSDPTPKEIADTILKYYQLPALQKINLRKNARKTWNDKYSAEKNYLMFVEELLAI